MNFTQKGMTINSSSNDTNDKGVKWNSSSAVLSQSISVVNGAMVKVLKSLKIGAQNEKTLSELSLLD